MKQTYYERTAPSYDALHVHANDEHYIALRYLSALITMLGAKSVLDVGSGTGRAIEFIRKYHPGVRVVGIEPESSMCRVAIEAKGIPKDSIVLGSGVHLPFADGAFDVVCEFGVLHHVKSSEVMVKEMMRVARKCVSLSDENRFAHGSYFTRWIKLCLCRVNLFPFFYWAITKGKSSRYSEEDGIAYSYSAFDSIDMLTRWSDRLMTVSLDRSVMQPTWIPISTVFHPLFSSFRLLLVAIRDL